MDKCFIIGGGESLVGFDFTILKDHDVIAVNNSILDAPFAKYFITMDYTFIDYKINKNLFSSFPATKYFVVAINNNYIQYKNNQYIDTRNNYKYDLSLINYVVPAKHEFGIGNSIQNFVHGCCSGYSALQLAIVLGYTEIYLLGIDMTASAKTHYHAGYNANLSFFKNKLRFYYPLFLKGLYAIKKDFPLVKIYSCSEHSPLNREIEYKPLEELKNDL